MRVWLVVLMVGVFPSPGNDGMAPGEPKLSPSALAPAQVTDLSARALTDSAIVLQWTEVRSSNTSIPRYVVRYDSLGKFQWGTAQDLLTMGCGAPLVGANTTGGRFHACVIWNLQPNTAYRFQMVAYTGTLNSTAVFGPLSNIADATTMTRLGPLLLWRPRMYRDTLAVSGIVTPWGSWQVNVRFPFGDYIAEFKDTLGFTNGRGYLLVVHP